MSQRDFQAGEVTINDPEDIRLQLELSSLVTIIYELLKEQVIGQSKTFQVDGRKDVGASSSPFVGKPNPFTKAMDSLYDLGVITDEDVATVESLRKLRNRTAHEALTYALGIRRKGESPPWIEPDLLISAVAVLVKVSTHWSLVNAEATGAFDEVSDTEHEATPANLVVLRMLLDAVLESRL